LEFFQVSWAGPRQRSCSLRVQSLLTRRAAMCCGARKDITEVTVHLGTFGHAWCILLLRRVAASIGLRIGNEELVISYYGAGRERIGPAVCHGERARAGERFY